MPDGRTATIEDSHVGSSASVAVIDGGFDPVALPAELGDTLVVTVQGMGGLPTVYRQPVVRERPPTVVRTYPAQHKRDVPLNSRMVVVFSEPMDSASLAGAVSLAGGGLPVRGRVVIPANSGDIVRANFVPDLNLAPLTTYELQVGADARNRSGTPLAAAQRFDFTTGALTTDAPVPSVVILSPASGDTVPSEFMGFRASVTADLDLIEISWQVLDDPVDAPLGEIFSMGGNNLTPLISDAGTYNMNPQLGIGTHTFRMVATDAAGNTGYSEPITLTNARPDTKPRIMVRSFSVVEFEEQSVGSGVWEYAPQLVVSDAPGGTGLEIIGFQLLAIPGLSAPPGLYSGWTRKARSLDVAPGQDTQLFSWQAGDSWYFGWNGTRSSGGLASALLTYRDEAGHYYETRIEGPIVPGASPPSVTVWESCLHWEVPGDFYDPGYRCPAPSIRSTSTPVPPFVSVPVASHVLPTDAPVKVEGRSATGPRPTD